jgi:DNA-binding PucR family transcriptional regulator
VLLTRTGRRQVQDQLVRELGPVLAEQRLRGVPLLQTLETYLDLGRRPTATAAALSVHVSTVYQRLTTLERLLGTNWRQRALDFQVLLRLHHAAATWRTSDRRG